MVADPIADMLIQIKNAGMAGKKQICVPYSKLKFEIANVMKKHGYIEAFDVKGKKIKKHLEVNIAYKDPSTSSGQVKKLPRIEDVKRISSLSRRVYTRARDIRPVKQGFGILVLSTPKGLLTGRDARKANLGGEALFKIW